MASVEIDISDSPTRLDGAGTSVGTWYRLSIISMDSSNITSRLRVSQVSGTDAPDLTMPYAADAYRFGERFYIQPESGESIWAWCEGCTMATVHFIEVPTS